MFNLSGACMPPVPLRKRRVLPPCWHVFLLAAEPDVEEKKVRKPTCRVCLTASIRRISIAQMATVVRLNRDPVEPHQASGTHHLWGLDYRTAQSTQGAIVKFPGLLASDFRVGGMSAVRDRGRIWDQIDPQATHL